MTYLLNNYVPRLLTTVLVFSLITRTTSVGSNTTEYKLNSQNNQKNNVTIAKEATVSKSTLQSTETEEHGHRGREHIDPSLEINTNLSRIESTNAKQIDINASANHNISKATTAKSKSTTSTTKSTTTKSTTVKPTKPLRTEHDEIVMAPIKSNVDTPTMSHIDPTMDKKVRRADYVVPIVAVILSVPLVTVVISVLYKKGKDWWQHRNYRRMNYLIDGMYNS